MNHLIYPALLHNPDVIKYEYDLDKAREILAGIGWVDKDGDGIREDDESNTRQGRGQSPHLPQCSFLHGGACLVWCGMLMPPG